ncbi:MAG: hypothetical protein KAX41_02215 [Citrobacter sp.]|nr:hypothetical protein [Citrobacter sp.]
MSRTVKFWCCAGCQSHYQGEKHCIVCGTGIYSIDGPLGGHNT